MSNLVVNHYGYSEFVDHALNRTKAPHVSDDSSRCGSFDFTQTKNFEEAVDFARNGWDLGLEQFAIEDGVLASGSTELNPRVTGFVPHVPNFVNNFPEQMYYIEDMREYNLPTLDIYVPLSYNSWVEGEDALRFSKSLVAYVNRISSKYNVRICGFFSVDSSGKRIYDVIVLKDFDSSLVINNLAFAFHPGFFRRIWFSVFEGSQYWSYGYGRSIKDFKDDILKIVPSSSEAVVMFKNLQDIKTSDYDFDYDDISRVVHIDTPNNIKG